MRLTAANAFMQILLVGWHEHSQAFGRQQGLHFMDEARVEGGQCLEGLSTEHSIDQDVCKGLSAVSTERLAFGAHDLTSMKLLLS